MSVSDAQNIKDFMRVVELEDGFVMEVGVVGWKDSHTPFIHWKPYRRWRLAAAQQKALQEYRFFRICQICQDRHNVGHMFNSDICQSCAERDLRVVF
jgi:hypothetical protein